MGAENGMPAHGDRRLALIGAEESLSAPRDVAQARGLAFESLALGTRDQFNFDLAPVLERFPVAGWKLFVALDERAVNYARLQLAAQVKLAGYETVNLISPQAFVSPSARLDGNVLVEAHASVGARARIGHATWLRTGALVGEAAAIGSGCTLGERARVGHHCTIGSGTTLGPDAVLAIGLAVGRHCELLLAKTYSAPVPDRSFIDRFFPDGARILGQA